MERNILAKVVHGSSVGEAPAQHTSHCPTASKEAGRRGRTGTPGLRVFLMWLRSQDLSRCAVLKLGRVGKRKLISRQPSMRQLWRILD